MRRTDEDQHSTRTVQVGIHVSSPTMQPTSPTHLADPPHCSINWHTSPTSIMRSTVLIISALAATSALQVCPSLRQRFIDSAVAPLDLYPWVKLNACTCTCAFSGVTAAQVETYSHAAFCREGARAARGGFPRLWKGERQVCLLLARLPWCSRCHP